MQEDPGRTDTVLKTWFSQKPVFALMGEFSAGKSTLLNLLLGGDVLPTQVTATNMPVTWLTYGENRRATVLRRDGVLEGFDISTLRTRCKMDDLVIRLNLPINILKRTDVIDTPGISDPRLAVDALKFLAPYLDFVVWCSPSNQAWRQTEKAMWLSMPQGLRPNSILALTRADILKNAADLQKVLRRCQKETDGLFGGITLISSMAALAARAENDSVQDREAWTKSFASGLFDLLETSISNAEKLCHIREKLTLTKADLRAVTGQTKPRVAASRRTTQGDAAIRSKKRKTDPETASTKTKKLSQGTGIDRISNLRAALTEMRHSSLLKSPKNLFFAELVRLFDNFRWDESISDAHRMVLRQVMSLERSGDAPQDKVLLQLERELEDFANSPWCKLDQTH